MKITKYYFLHEKMNGEYLLFNTLTCKIIEANAEFISQFEKIKNNPKANIDIDIKNTLIKNEILVSPSFEEEYISKAHDKYLTSLNDIPLTNFVFLTYDCNLRCTYCCYRYLNRKVPVMNKDLINNMFDTMHNLQLIKQKKSSRIVLSGGEPLLPENEPEIEYFFTKLEEYINYENSMDRKVIFTIFTNATNIEYFEKYLIEKKPIIDMVYVTLNGPKEMHDQHRIQINKQGSFDMTIAGIEKLLDIGIPTWSVANIGKDNVRKLNLLSSLIKELGWDKNDFYQGIYISRIKNHKKEDKIAISEHEMIEAIIEQVTNNEIDINDFNFGDLKLLRVIMDFVQSAKNNKEMRLQFSGCNNRSSQYSYSVDGKMYPCAPSMGIQKYATGTFYPQINIENIDQRNWLDRLLPSIPKCKECPVAFLCGGGCTFEALEKNNDAQNPTCVNADKILSTYLHAFENGIQIIHDDIIYK